jgi:signal recognition particle receptor subunit beta
VPHIDARSGEVVIRIVYDGAPEAGKTTNVVQLGSLISLQRRGQAKSPGTAGDRTEFFDWLDFSGGYLDGRKVRCQLVSVPGQPRLLHRRRYLLEKADAIVYVADSRRDTFAGAVQSFTNTLRIVEQVAGPVPVGVILQANKQDIAGAVAPTEVAAALGIAAGTPVVGSIASTGEGVMQTFILAVRLATDRVRALMLGQTISDLQLICETPELLHATMLELEAESLASVSRTIGASRPEPASASSPSLPVAANTAVVAAASRDHDERARQDAIAAARFIAERAEAARREAAARRTEREAVEREAAERAAREAVEREAAERAAREAVEREAAERAAREAVEREAAERAAREAVERDTREAAGRRLNQVPAGALPPLPIAAETASGHVWPPVKGRISISAAVSGTMSIPALVQPWAPFGALELVSVSGWILHSADRWVDDNESTARLRLLGYVRGLVARGSGIPEGRTLTLARDGEHWRLWLLTPMVATLRQRLVDTLASSAAPASVINDVILALRELRELGVSGRPIAAGLAGLAGLAGRLAVLGLDEPEHEPALDACEPFAELATVIDAHLSSLALRRWFDEEGRNVLEKARPL